MLRTSIDGLDTERGLRQADGNPVLYRRLLRSFAREEADAPKCIRHAADAAGAVQIARQLKRKAQDIGAGEVAHAVGALQAALVRTGRLPDSSLLLRVVERALMPLIHALASATELQPWAYAVVSHEANQPSFGHLASLLDDGDRAAVKYFEVHRAALEGTLQTNPLGVSSWCSCMADFPNGD